MRPYGTAMPQILPLKTAVFQANPGMLARFGYFLTASPDRYSVRSWNFASSSAGTFLRPWFGGNHMRSGMSPPAMVALNFAR